MTTFAFLLMLIGCTDTTLEQRILKLESQQALEQSEWAELESRLQVLEAGPKRPTRTTTPTEPAPKINGVRKLSETEALIERTTLDEQEPEDVLRTLRLIPHTNGDGEVDGYRMYGMPRTILLTALGLKSGDTIHAVNDKPVSDQAAMEMLATSTDIDEFTLDLTRRGRAHTLVIRVVETLPEEPEPKPEPTQ